MTLRWIQLEYVGKGLALAWLAALAILDPAWEQTLTFFAATFLGLGTALALAARASLRAGIPTRGRLAAFLVFLLLENPALVYAGILGGMFLGAELEVYWFGAWTVMELLAAMGAGGVLGLIFWQVRRLGHRWLRTGTVLFLAALAAAGGVYWLEHSTAVLQGGQRYLLGVHLLLAIPVFYLLTFAGRAEETEMEIGAMCVVLGVSLWMLLPQQMAVLAPLLPVAVYFLYTQRVLRPLQVFKHVLHGMSYLTLGMHKEALLSFRRALRINPRNPRAREGHWAVYRQMDFTQAALDPETVRLLDLDLCLERATELLLAPRPGSDRLEEAQRLLTLILDQRPAMQPVIYYWRAVAHVHGRELDKAEGELRTILDPEAYPPGDPYRESVLLSAWQLALVQHRELGQRLGQALLGPEGRRLDAIAALERHRARHPDDPGAAELRRFLYEGLTEEEVSRRAGAGRALPPEEFDHAYCLELGRPLLADPAAWRRGAEYLRIAALGLPGHGPSIYHQIANACQREGDEEGIRYHGEMVKLLARELGIKNLAGAEKEAYFATVKELGEAAYAKGDIDRAIENLSLYVESEQSGLDTIRLLTELYQKKGDVLGALHMNEKALVYDPRSKLFLERKEQYYYSLPPAELAARADLVRRTFDTGYCLRKARSLLDHRSAGTEQIDWAGQLVELARVISPEDVQGLVLAARVKLRRGETEGALLLLEKARKGRPERFASADEEEAWYAGCRLLADLYLAANRPDQALACLSDYRKHAKSGADTVFKMGQAYEQLGDRVKAAKCYQNVTIYDHPLAADAYAALRRLGAEPPG